MMRFRTKIAILLLSLSVLKASASPDGLKTEMVSALANSVFIGEVAQLAIFEPELVFHAREIPGFSKPNQKLFEVRYLDKHKGLQILLWINLEDRLAFLACRGREFQAGACAFYRGLNGGQSTDTSGRIVKFPKEKQQ